MLGERGMWYKKTFFESSIRVPLIIYSPKFFKHKTVINNTSLVDIFPTILDICNYNFEDYKKHLELDGNSLLNLINLNNMNSKKTNDIIYSEQNDSGTIAPRLMVKKNQFKFIYSEAYPPMLFDLSKDPNELDNLILSNNNNSEIEKEMRSLVYKKWDINNLKSKVMRHQKKSILVSNALSKGKIFYWEFKSTVNDKKRYVRYGNKFPDVDRNFYVPYQ